MSSVPVRLAPGETSEVVFEVLAPDAGKTFVYPFTVCVTDDEALYLLQGRITISSRPEEPGEEPQESGGEQGTPVADARRS